MVALCLGQVHDVFPADLLVKTTQLVVFDVFRTIQEPNHFVLQNSDSSFRTSWAVQTKKDGSAFLGAECPG